MWRHGFYPKKVRGVWGVFALFCLALIVVLLWINDLRLANYLAGQAANHAYLATFADFMDRSLFNGDSFGGQDVSYLLVSPFVVFYLLCAIIPRLQRNFKDSGFYKNAGFLFSCSLVLFVVCRVVKTFFRRVRPGDLGKVVDGIAQDYSGMWMVGSQKLSVAVSKGSFISGHTTTAAVLIALAYAVYSAKRSWLSRSAIVVSIIWTFLLGFGRVCSGDHYPSDVFWSIVISALLIEWLYRSVFMVDLQKKGQFILGRESGELFWSLYFILFALSILATALAVESIVINHQWLGAPFLVMGTIVGWFSFSKMQRVLGGICPNESK